MCTKPEGRVSHAVIVPNSTLHGKFRDFSFHPKDEYNWANATSVTVGPFGSTAQHSPGCVKMTMFHGTSSSKLTAAIMGTKVKLTAVTHLLPPKTFWKFGGYSGSLAVSLEVWWESVSCALYFPGL